VLLSLPAGASARLLVGVGYGIVFTDGWTSPDGIRYDYAPEAVILSIGPQWEMGQRRALAVDVQWNPAVAHVRRWGRVPEWASRSPWVRTLAVGSVGAHWTLPTTRGPLIAVALRTYIHLHPYALASGGLWPALGVVLRAR
jgi:hypothetical protein